MKIFSVLLYYCVLLPISVTPFGILHAEASLLYVILYYVIGYRKDVVFENLRNSFPEKTEEERKLIAKKFYKQLCDIFLEGQKPFTISKKQLDKHITCVNPELMNGYYDQGKSVIIAVGHYNSWELMLTAFNSFIKHKAVVIYQPLSDEFLDKKMCDGRSEHGTMMLSTKDVREFFKAPSKELFGTVFAIDQSPSDPTKCYWMKFLNQDTPVLFGTEKYAKDFDQPVVFARLTKVKRGYYQLEFVDVCSNPTATRHGEITEKVTQILEKEIIAHPEFWLWSHKRWKHKRTQTSES